ncbi:tectonic-1 isoform X2 [Adelges cooleyi]|uniref:tectonic-1 isoform X2 n=1 Tax=Adelges cooleyi TaxID=133065 RepID=UPI00218006E6|nr:tectonic-1 isoform X2 [Adelges cooleyi]
MIFEFVWYVLPLSCVVGLTGTSKECVGKACTDKPPMTISTPLKAVTVSSLNGNESTSINISYNTTTGNGTNVDKSFGVILIETPVPHANDTFVNYTISGSPAVVQNASSTIANNKTGNAVLPVNTIETTTATTTTTTAGHVLGYVQNTGDQYCGCDLIHGACDINCCCDTDCMSNDLKTFTLCSDKTVSGSIKPESILFDSSLFYVVLDNVPSNYFYPEREPVETETQVNAILRSRGAIEWHESSQVVDTRNRLDLTYGSLHWMYVVSNVNGSDWMAFGVKNSAFSSLCAIQEPVEYLVNKETTCEVYIQNLTEMCKNNSELSYKRFYHDREFRVVQTTYNQSSKTEVISILGEFQDIMVSSMGDPVVSVWIPITVAKLTLDDQCSTFINIVKIHVFYSYVGSFENPQATIHGILVNFTSTINTTQIALVKPTIEIPIKSSVIFVDLTKPPIREFAEPPTYEFRLPEDFYYPFLSHGSKLLLYPKLNLFLMLTVINLQIIMFK